MLKSRVKIAIGIVTSIIATLFTYRSVFSGKLLGDPFDSRLHIILHEHWWRWLNGLVAFRDTEFFYPFDKALGYSDVFLTQGVAYSFFRLVGFNLANSWTITTFLLLIIGNIGWVFVARKFIKSYFIQIILILTIITSLSFVYYFTFNPNIVGYSYLSWIALFISNIQEEKNKVSRHRKISLFITAMLIYALSCWYGAFFVALIILIRLLLAIVFERSYVRNVALELKDSKVLRQHAYQLPIQLFFLWIFVYVYVSVLDEPERSVEELFRNSPRLDLITNGSNVDGTKLSGSVFKNLYLYLGFDFEEEYGIGIGIFAFLFFTVSLIVGLVRKEFNRNLTLWITSIIGLYFYFVVYFDQFSLHRFFFEHVPGFNSIRCPSRYVIVLGYFAIFLIMFVADRVLQKTQSTRIKFVTIFILILLLTDQYRSSYKGWNSDVLINTDLMSQKDEIIKNCDYFYYDFPGGWWYDQIEAMTFAIQIGVPTVNGYSGAFPPGYPTETFTSNDEPLKIFDWIAKIDKSKRGCFVTGRSEIKSLNKDFDSIDFIGFTNAESDSTNSWRWAVSPNPYLYILSNSFKVRELNFEINSAKCSPVQVIKIRDGQDNDLIEPITVNEKNQFSLDLDMTNSVVKRIQIITDSGGCQVENDPRKLFFEIKNFTIDN